MLHGRDPGVALGQYGASLSVNDILCDSINDGLALQVDTLDFISRVFWSGIESNCKIQACMQSFAKERETAFQCFLFHLGYFGLLIFGFRFLEFFYLLAQGTQFPVHIGQALHDGL